uniref:Uncharacterized protein n=1 Tax=Trichuris muris TaxID=70415 RepID=A0A5S6QXF9_TRIMR
MERLCFAQLCAQLICGELAAVQFLKQRGLIHQHWRRRLSRKEHALRHCRAVSVGLKGLMGDRRVHWNRKHRFAAAVEVRTKVLSRQREQRSRKAAGPVDPCLVALHHGKDRHSFLCAILPSVQMAAAPRCYQFGMHKAAAPL